jgi:uncharacterized phiE125 gp8 family phage protein
MSLPDRDAVKARLRIENTVEDDVIDAMILSAKAFIEEFVGRPIAATERRWLIEYPGPGFDRCVPADRLFLPLYPVKHEDPDFVTITDADGEEVSADDFRVNTQRGMVVATNCVFNNFPYEVTAKVGLELLDGYATRVEPNLSQALIDLCADWYQRRNPGAFTEGAGGGVMTQWMGTGTGGMESVGTPARALDVLKMYRMIKAV